MTSHVVLRLVPILLALVLCAGSGLNFVEYADNPLFPPDPMYDQAFVLKDDVGYKLYYPGNDYASINLAESTSGLVWVPYAQNPIVDDGQVHCDVHYYATAFTGQNIGDNSSGATDMHYRMWYQSTSISWRYAESPDSHSWYNRVDMCQFGTPLFGPTVGTTYGIVDTVYTVGAANTGNDWTFRLYANVQWEGPPYSARECVVVGYSANGYNVTGYDPMSTGEATPIFGGTLNSTDFDADHVGWFKVIKNSDTDWIAFYSGGALNTYAGHNGIGYAESSDGYNWTRIAPIFTTHDGVAWRNVTTWMPSAVKEGDVYRMWFLGSNDTTLITGESTWLSFYLGTASSEAATTTPTVTTTAAITTTTHHASTTHHPSTTHHSSTAAPIGYTTVFPFVLVLVVAIIGIACAVAYHFNRPHQQLPIRVVEPNMYNVNYWISR
jgi:hypothetical protein